VARRLTCQNPDDTVVTVTLEWDDYPGEWRTHPEWMAHEIENEQALIAGAQPT